MSLACAEPEPTPNPTPTSILMFRLLLWKQHRRPQPSPPSQTPQSVAAAIQLLKPQTTSGLSLPFQIEDIGGGNEFVNSFGIIRYSRDARHGHGTIDTLPVGSTMAASPCINPEPIIYLAGRAYNIHIVRSTFLTLRRISSRKGEVICLSRIRI